MWLPSALLGSLREAVTFQPEAAPADDSTASDHKGNWQPILLAAMVVAQKVWDDQSLLNVDFSAICTAYTVQDINRLEKKVVAPPPPPHPPPPTPRCPPRDPLAVPSAPSRGCTWFTPSRLHHAPPPEETPAHHHRPATYECVCRMQFLELIGYNVSITASLYASYYFELRTLCEKADAACGQSGHLRGPQLATWVSSDCI